ncbi:hypothetical protein DV515_00015605 [Chloebia gouldiae]|uniref:Uncharacterized protein n=1 Tax=Chloebia gouldiae TaxID=44316 RepID=A0A3L8RUS0_CHLGU|nr:hypothetical protein DV515_00015605 [Chloebia gouldiae]
MGIIPRGSSHDSLEQDLLPVPRYSSRTPTSTFPRTSWARSLRALQALPDYDLQRSTLRNDALLCCETQSHLKY